MNVVAHAYTFKTMWDSWAESIHDSVCILNIMHAHYMTITTHSNWWWHCPDCPASLLSTGSANLCDQNSRHLSWIWQRYHESMHNVVYIQIQSQPVRVYINLFLMHQPATCFVSVIVDNHNLDMHCSQGMDSLILYNHSIDLFAVDSTSCSYKYTASKTVFSISYRVTCTLVYSPYLSH